ncbi:MAG: SEC-C domain-containing protein [Actinobacteria bacterium]|nr:SEC-C domain-containing protein [Actinomycetota bacterium]
MDAARIAFVFDRNLDPGEIDLDDENQLYDLVAGAFPGLDEGQVAPRMAVAKMILADDPPVMWETVERLTADGVARDDIWSGLALTVLVALRDVMDGDAEAMSPERLGERLAQLPIPGWGDVYDVIERTVGDRTDLDVDALGDVVRRQFGFGDTDAGQVVLDRVVDDLVEVGDLVLVADDVVVDPVRLVAASVFTHRLTDDEIRNDVLDLGFDLAVYASLDHVHLDDVDDGAVAEAVMGLDMADRTGPGWQGPSGWLDRFTPGALVAVRVTPSEPGDCANRLHIEPVDDAIVGGPAWSDATEGSLWVSVVEDETAESGLPLGAAELVCALVVRDADVFATPGPPLVERCMAAGLQIRRDAVAADEVAWYASARLRRTARLVDQIDDDDDQLFHLLELFASLDVVAGVDPSWVDRTDAGPVDDGELRGILDDLDDPVTMTVVAQEVFADPPVDDDLPGMPGTIAAATAIVDAFTRVARTGTEKVIAHWFAAIACERAGDPVTAEQHLEIAHEADPTDSRPTDRLAWYAFDRGEIDRAETLWQRVPSTDTIEQDLAELVTAKASAGTRPGRNEPCWCGSGRKYKQCHNPQVSPPPLAERIGWLCRKATTFLERRGGRADEMVWAVAESRALDPDDPDSLAEAFADPIVLDLVLTEGGWFERFLDERGPLLPDDEALLAHSWTLVDRSVFEVTDVRPGEGMTLVNLADSAVVDVRERTLSNQVSVGMLCCARVVPDGVTHRFVGGIFGVQVGQEARVLDLCETGDPFAIARWVADSHRPPVVTTREGERMVQCRVVLAVRDADAARRVLERTYEPDDSPSGGDNRWLDLVDVDGTGEEFIIRANLKLEGDRIIVETNSEARADRVVDTLTKRLRSARVVADERTPIDTAAMIRSARAARVAGGAGVGGGTVALPKPPDLDDPEMLATLETIRDRYERQWCDEPVPALGGVTPRAAAADPTRRESLERLLRSFEHSPGAEGPIGPMMRPERIRELLGLD